jgi:hypothetical protein
MDDIGIGRVSLPSRTLNVSRVAVTTVPVSQPSIRLGARRRTRESGGTEATCPATPDADRRRLKRRSLPRAIAVLAGHCPIMPSRRSG